MGKRKVFFIGIVEDKEENTIRYIEKLLLEEEWEIVYRNKKENILGLNREEISVFLITTEPENLELYYSLDFNFDIILYNSEITLDYKFLNCDYFILNSDEENWLNLPLDKLRPLVISYGFNNRATVTVSSYSDEGGYLNVNIYLQREITTISKSELEPFEFTVKVKEHFRTNSETVIYKILAAATTSLIFGNRKSYIDIKM